MRTWLPTYTSHRCPPAPRRRFDRVQFIASVNDAEQGPIACAAVTTTPVLLLNSAPAPRPLGAGSLAMAYCAGSFVVPLQGQKLEDRLAVQLAASYTDGGGF